MPLRNVDPFLDHTARMDPTKNRYVQTMRQDSPSLPVLHGPALKGRRGQWRQSLALPAETPLVLEIGCHKGRVLAKLAQNHSTTHFLGIDITMKRVVMTAERATRKSLTNVHVLYANAKGLPELFAEGELDGVIIFFPDPWLKRRQSKHRLVDQTCAQEIARCLARSGYCWFKTDQQAYFLEAADYFQSAGLQPTDLPKEFASSDYKSSFEERFEKLGTPAHGGFFRKNV